MKDFRELLKVRDEFRSYRLFEAINVGNYEVSIQGSQSHYCNPRETIPVDQYESMEIAIFDKDAWINPFSDERLKDFDRLEELLEHYENSSCPIGGYVPIDLIQALCDYLENAK